MANLRYLPKAIDDLTSIEEYTFEEWGDRQANFYYRMLVDGCERIARRPELGKSYEGTASDLFGYRVSSHLIFYRVLSSDQVEIVRILHSQMNFQRRLKE